MAKFTYKAVGGDRDTHAEFVAAIARHMRRTFGPEVIPNFGGFAGLFALAEQGRFWSRRYRDPVLVACADGVGTKLKIACALGRHDTVGIDLVAMNVNDLITLGAVPLFFLDYLAVGDLANATKAAILKGIADGCAQAGCALLDGETATMTDFYTPGEYGLAGFAVGIAERRRLVDGHAVQPGQAIIGLASSGLHNNGFTLARRVLLAEAKMPLEGHVASLGCTLGEELLRPTRIYVAAVHAVCAAYRRKHVPAAIAHITGGGLLANVPRVLPPHCEAHIRRGAWPEPPIFDLIRRTGEIDEDEMFRVFNMGIGMVMIVPPYYVDATLERLSRVGVPAYVIGEVRRGTRAVRLSS